MPHDNVPLMTSRQAKRNYQKSGKRFKFTPSQYRAAERRSELEERRKKTVAAEEKRKGNKRKRDEKDERERDNKRRQLAEGKISIEDTWGKVRASQPRLSFFGKTAAPVVRAATPTPEPESEVERKSEVEIGTQTEAGSDSEDCEALDEQSEEETIACEQPVKRAEGVKSPASPATAMISVMKLISHFASLRLSNFIPQKPQSLKRQTRHSTPEPLPMATNTLPKEDREQDLLDAQLQFSQSVWDFIIAEDGVDIDMDILEDQPRDPKLPSLPANNSKATSPGAMKDSDTTSTPSKRKATDSHHSSFCSPSKSMRSALSEMTRSDVNVRAQEKPDVTSTPKAGSALLSPSPKKDRSAKAETPADVLAMLSTQDLEIDLEDALNEKENEDPWRPVAKVGSQKQILGDKTSLYTKLPKSSPSQRKSHLVDEFLDLDDIDDAFFDLDDELSTDADEFDDGGAADSIFAQMSTQAVFGKPTTTNTTAHISTSPKTATNKITSSSPSRTRSGRPFAKANSFAFGSDALDDDFLAELTELADKAEAEAAAARPKKKGRRIPWLHRTASQEAAKQVQDEDAYFDEFLTSSPELSQV